MKRKFGKSSAELEANIEGYLEDRFREIITDFDYWWTYVSPGFVLPTGFPYSVLPALLAGRFVDQGWLMLQEGVEFYQLQFASSQSTTAPSSFAPAEASRIRFASLYDVSGTFLDNLAVDNPEGYFSKGSYGSVNKGTPICCTPHTINGATYLRFRPTPDREYFVALGFQLATIPFVPDGASRTNLLLETYPRVVMQMAGLEYAEYYHDDKMLQFYYRELYGQTDSGKIRGDMNWEGSIGRMKRDTLRRFMQDSDELPQWKSVAESVGRGGPGSHSPFESNYYGPPWYG